MTEELKLDRSFLHTQFSSWRLQRLAVVNRYQLCATGHASGVATTALDFLHTRASVLRNHLLLSEGRLFIFTQSEHSPGYFIYELLPVPSSDQGLLASQVAELPSDAGEEAAGGAVEALVDCSLAVVSEPHAPHGAVSGAAADVDKSAAAETHDHLHHHHHRSHRQLLLSRGHGDIVLMRRRGDRVAYSNVVHPLRPQLPYTGVRPLILEAAFANENGDITAIVWAMRSKGPHLAACCEVFAVTLRPREDGEAAPAAEEAEMVEAAPGRIQIHLTTVGVRLLLRTKLPPFLVRVLPPEGTAAEAQQPLEAPAAAATHGSGGQHRVVLLGFDPNASGLEEDPEEGGPAPLQPAAAGGGGDRTAPGGGGADDDEDDMDPRTLEQAAARLAHMTSEEREGAQPQPQWADIYKESGPDGVGAMGNEPAVDLAAWRLPAGAGDDGSGSSDVGQSAGKALTPFWRLCCGAHRLLTAEEAVGPLGHPSLRHRQSQAPAYQPLPSDPLLLLGLTDDVDCAVVRLDGWRGTRQDVQEGSGAGPAGQSEAGQPGPPDGLLQPCQVRHVGSIPALAYVAAGKTHKRHLLLSNSAAGSPSHSSSGSSSSVQTGVAAVLVENQRFMYLYGSTPTGEEYGKQQVVDLGLEEGETVLGARLVEVATEAEQQGGSSTTSAMVVVATQRRLLSYRLRM